MNSPEEPALDAAACWLARLRAADVTVFEQRTFRRWLHASRVHLEAFEAVLSLWDRLAVLQHASPASSAGAITGHGVPREREQP